MAKILVADDVKEMRVLLRGILESAGHEVVEAPNGAFVLDTLRSGQDFALLLLDIKMPMMDGIQVMKRLREETLDFIKPKVCFISGQSDKEMVLKAVALGAEGYIVKPIDAAVVLDKVQKILSAPGSDGKSAPTRRDINIGAVVPGVPLVETVQMLWINTSDCAARVPFDLRPDGMIDLESPLWAQAFGGGAPARKLRVKSSARSDRGFVVIMSLGDMSDSEQKSLQAFLAGA